jgi:sodium-dependent phosphate transporter
MPAFPQYDWIIALITIAFCGSSFGNGANDVANAYATSVAARTLTMLQVGFLSMITEFVGAVALGAKVTKTIKNGIINLDHFEAKPATLILVMGCAEFGSAFWLLFATGQGFPVSTTQTIVGALIGAGIASGANIKWAWASGSVSQIAASWAISPLIAAGFSAVVFGTIKYSVLERRDSLKWGMRLIPFYLALTAGILSLFIIIEIPDMDSLEDFGAGKISGIILGVFGGCLLIAYGFFLPYFNRRLIKEDARLRARHILLGPLLWANDPWVPFPAPVDGEVVIDYYKSAHKAQTVLGAVEGSDDGKKPASAEGGPEAGSTDAEKGVPATSALAAKEFLDPEERWIIPYKHLPLVHPTRMWNMFKWLLLQGINRDCVTFDSDHLARTHARAIIYDNKVEHLWTYAQVASAMVMSIAHGSNDVANAVGPWVAAYETWRAGSVESKTDTPIFILVVAGFLLGAGFWFFGFHIIRALGNRITQVSPTRGFSMELGAAITVLLASRLALPVSTTQCLTGATVGVALMNYDLKAVNWRQMLYIFMGWILTLPTAGLIAGLLCGMALNTPHF